MEKISFRTEGGVCSRAMHVVIENGVILSLKVEGGCPGNLQGICQLVAGMKVEEVISRLSGIRCGDKDTSCPDQLARSLQKILQKKAQ